MLGKLARRCAARAKIDLLKEYEDFVDLAPAEGVRIRVLDDLEPWSKDWLEWWEEDTKIYFDDGERASDMA